MLASLLRIILLTATLKILERGLDKGPIILRYIGAENQRFNDGLDYIEDAENIEQIRHTFKLIFDVMEQTQHYNMMMEPA